MKDLFSLLLVGTTLVTQTGAQLTQLLGDGGYTTFQDVSGWANLAIDIGNMRDASTSQAMQDIYTNGKNAKYTDEDGNEKTRSLQSLSLGVYDEFKEDAIYNFYRHAFIQIGEVVEGEELGKFDEKPVAQYADTIVLDLLALNKAKPAPEAVIIMNVWMYVVHQIYEVIRACQRQDDQTIKDMEAALDIAAALWIGAGQEKGDEDSGNSLYRLAEQAGGHFNQNTDGQATVNKAVMGGFEAFKLAIGVGSCVNDADAYVGLRTEARKLIGQMTIPFIQLMIHHIQQPESVENSDFAELYALAIGARVEACVPTAYDELLNLFVRQGFKVSNAARAIEVLQNVYSCVEVTCADVGSYRAGEVPACTELTAEEVKFAGYPQTFDARPAARIDRDIEQIRILVKARAYVAALDYYEHGYNAVEDGNKFLSLKTLATGSSRSVVGTQYNLFSGFFLGGDKYADAIITDALNGSGLFTGAKPAQIAAAVSGVLTNLVMYMAVLERVYAAIETCKAGGDGAADGSALQIDQGVAFYVGSIEGPNEGGRDGGQLLFAAAKKLCPNFGVCTNTTNGDATSNVDVIQAFKDISDELVQSECLAAEEIVDGELAPGLLVPLIQGTLFYAVQNDALTVNTDSPDLGAGYAYAQSILPLIDAADSASGTVLARNMDFNLLDDPVQDGPAEVFGAVKTGIQKLTTPSMAEECPVIGLYGDGSLGDICDGLNFQPRPPTSPAPTSAPPPPTDPTPTVVPDPAPSSPVLSSIAPSSLPVTSAPVPSASPVEAPPTDPTALGFGRYIFANDVMNIAKLADDVRDMKQGSLDNAKKIYEDGGSTVVNGGSVVSLSAIATTAATTMSDDPMFNIFRWALLEESVFDKVDTDDFDALDSAYANIVVKKALEVASNQTLAAETAVVMVVWMEICHELYNSIDYCSEADGQSVRAIDRAVALWIGAEQAENSFDTGHMMYHIAQQAEQNFGLNSGEALANSKIIEEFNEAQQLAKGCEADRENFLEMKIVVSRIIKQMTVPLIQNLIHHINQREENSVELYALAAIPQAIACGSSDFIGLRDVLLDIKDFNPQSIDDLFAQEMQRFQKCLRISCADILGNARPSQPPLRDLIDRLCVDDSSSDSLVGFEPVNDVYEISRLDLDILQIGIFMETKAYAAAEDLYTNGYNSQGTGTLKPLSLRQLAKSTDRNVVPQFMTFSTYYQSDDYSDQLVLDALRRQNLFKDASRDQAAEGVTRALQAVVSFMAMLEKFYGAIELCRNGAGAVERWEEGIALYVGSLEGPEPGGEGTWDGTLMYALGKETCDVFGTCGGNGDATINENIIENMGNARDLLQQNKCDDVDDILSVDIFGDLPVPIIQGVLFYATENADLKPGNDTYALAAGHVFARAILPLINRVNATSAEKLSAELGFDPAGQPVPDGADSVYEAITFVLTGMDTDCDDIGVYKGRSTCNTEVVAPVADKPTNLGSGLYTTTTYVQDRADIALDLIAIRGALESNSVELARIVYRDGENSKIYNEDGIKVGQRSLERFSSVATVSMAHEPLLNIYRYALEDANGQYSGRDSRLYADTIVSQLLQSVDQTDKSLAAEAMLVLNLWMFLAHELFETLKNCKNKVVSDLDGVHSIDEAVAYWIGDGQIAGDGDNGHLFYALAERMGDKFQMNVNGQSRTNVNILRYFNQAKLELSFPNACSENPKTYPRLRQIVYRIFSQMTIPLVQSLVHNLRVNNRQAVKLYAQSVVPLISACDPELFSFLQLKLIALDYNVIETEDIVERLRSAYDCLGISCDDVGRHVSETDNICVDTPKRKPLAGYVPNTDVRDYAQLDLDILETKILMKMGAYDAVEDLYAHGKHAVVDGINGPEMLTLQQMATTSDRSIVPQFDSFVRYNEDNKYADTIIRTALDKTKLPFASPEQRTEIVVKSMQYMIIYMAALQAMHDSVDGCQSDDASRFAGAQEAWDRAAALLIGSIEGLLEGGDQTQNGQSFYALAKKRCAQFGTCGREGFSEVNEELISLLYTGKGEVEGGSCGALKRAVGEIEPLLLVPLIQSNLRYALANSRLDKATEDGDFAEGYVFSQAVLPLVEDVNRNSADAINRNMNFQFETDPVSDGSLAVFNAFAAVYSGMNVECSKLGATEGVEPCTGAQQKSAKSASNNAGMVVGIIIAVITAMGLVTYFVMRKRKEKKMEGDLAPMFRRSNGVMNHASNDILDGGKLNDADVVGGDEAFGHRMQVHADSLSMA